MITLMTVQRTDYTNGLDIKGSAFDGRNFIRLFLHTVSDPIMYVNDGGHYFQRTSMTISGSYQGTGDGYSIVPASSEPSMLNLRSDINGPAFQVRSQDSETCPNSRPIDCLDISGNHRFSVRNDGALSWGTSTYSAQDTFLKRDSANALKIHDGTSYGTLQANVQLGCAYASGAPTPTGYLIVKDSAGTSYKIPAEAA